MVVNFTISFCIGPSYMKLASVSFMLKSNLFIYKISIIDSLMENCIIRIQLNLALRSPD